ncbi:MAG: mannose-6-phosphate isomerase, class I [Ignavibacteria bacterium]|nr:mannose-6-phosphate isomerase, class I [Ignavibacteria bacterium]
MAVFEIKPYILESSIQNYQWGTKNDDAFIPKLLGIEPEKDKPYAELWIGAHKKLSSQVITDAGKVKFDDFINQYPEEILGKKAAGKFNNQLPYLFKILSAAEALSIQAHPNKEQAGELYKKDPQNYPDDNHKPEIAIALGDLTALVGFRSIDELIETLKYYSEIAEFVGAEFLKHPGSNDEEAKYWLKNLYSKLMIKALNDEDALEIALNNLEKNILSKDEKNEREMLFIELKRQYGNDVGLLSIFMLNLVHLKKGEGVFLKAGIPHAYLKGNIVECMANSDNVVRAGLTPKFKDVKTLVDILKYERAPVEILGKDSSGCDYVYKTPAPEFEIKKYQIEKDTIRLENSDTVSIFIIVEGKIRCKWLQKEVEFVKGQTVMIPAELNEYSIIASEDTLIYKAYIP